MSKIKPDQELIDCIFAKEWNELYAEELVIILDYAKEQQAIINDLKAQLNNMEQCYIEKKKQVDAVEHVLGCAMIGPKEVFMYANRIQKALRGEPCQ